VTAKDEYLSHGKRKPAEPKTNLTMSHQSRARLTFGQLRGPSEPSPSAHGSGDGHKVPCGLSERTTTGGYSSVNSQVRAWGPRWSGTGLSDSSDEFDSDYSGFFLPRSFGPDLFGSSSKELDQTFSVTCRSPIGEDLGMDTAGVQRRVAKPPAVT